MFEVRGMPYWVRKFSERSKADARAFMEEELKQLKDPYEPVTAAQAFIRVFETEKYWEQRWFKKDKSKVAKLLPAEDAKKLLENTLRPPINIFEPHVAEKSFAKTYGENVFLDLFERDPRKKPEPIEVAAAEGENVLPETIEDIQAANEAKIDGVGEYAEVIETAGLTPEQLAEAAAEYKKAQWRKIMCSKENCKNKANGEEPMPDRCGHHKEDK
jgi:hypothetical protein